MMAAVASRMRVPGRPIAAMLPAAGMLLVLLALLLATPAAAAPPTTSPTAPPHATATGTGTTTAKAAAPSLSIAVDNGRTTATVGEKLDYTVTVRNLGSAVVKNLLITQTVPTGLTFGSADHAGVTGAGKVSWRTEIPAGSSTAFHTTMTVTATPAELLRLASVACAAAAPDAPPIVCAAHSDALPAAAQAAGGARGAAGRTWWYVGGAALIVGLAAAMVLLRRRPRHRAA